MRDASIVSWKFCSSMTMAYAEPFAPPAPAGADPPGAAGAPPDGGAARFRADRSIAPGRENGC